MDPLLEVSGLVRRFGGLVAVNGLGLSVGASEILGLIGPNGSGKTTALNLLSGALKPDSGEIRLGGRPISRLSPERRARLGIARTFQLVRVLPSLDVRENVVAGLAFGAKPLWGAAADAQALRLLDRVGLGGRGARKGAELTYIDQKRLELARALALAPKLLLLDEWLAGLNPSELQDGVALIQSLRRDGLSIILVEHVMDAIRLLCDRCVVMNAGAMLAEGATETVLADPHVIRAYLGDPDA
jgi:branched-chain amino acid transport system ATP-binding protein